MKTFIQWFQKNILEEEEYDGLVDKFGSPAIVRKYFSSNKTRFSNAIKTYLNVPFSEKDAAKKLGLKWDSESKKWYHTSIPNGIPLVQILEKNPHWFKK